MPEAVTQSAPDLDRYPALQSKLYRVLDLANDPRNARVHDERNIASIMASLKEHGQRKNIVVDPDGTVRAGNGTLEAAKRLGWEFIVAGPSPEDVVKSKAYALADNRTAELAGWDNDVLAEALGDLNEANYDLAAVGFTHDEASALMAAVEQPMDLPGPVDAPEAPKAIDIPQAAGTNLPSALHQGSIRVVQLFMDAETHGHWEVALRQLSAEHGTKTASDTVVATVLEAAGIDWTPRASVKAG